MNTRKPLKAFSSIPSNLQPDSRDSARSLTKQVLLIDDEAPLRRVIQLTLKITAGWEVIVASSGREGIQQAEIEQPDVILLDLMMPELDGISTLKLLKKNPKTQHIPIILLTAKVQATQPLDIDPCSVSAILIKPFDPTTLAQEIKQSLGWS